MPVGHIEAGLRSFDRSLPEETNRVIVDAISQLLFIHSPGGAREPARRRSGGERDPLRRQHDDRHARRSRGANRDDRRRRRVTGSSAARISWSRCTGTGSSRTRSCWPSASPGSLRSRDELPVVFPMHPRTHAAVEELGLVRGEGLRLLPPLGYLEFLGARDRLGRRPDRLRRDPGGDDLPRHPVLHAPPEHGAADHRRAGDEHGARARSRADPRRAGADPLTPARGDGSRRSGTATPPGGSSKSWPGRSRTRARSRRPRHDA